MASSLALGLMQMTGAALLNAVQDRFAVRGKRLPPSPPITNPWLGHLHEIRTEGFIRFGQRCVAEHGPLVLLRFGPPVLGRRFLLVADPEVARLTLTQDLQRGFPPGTGPMLVFGEDAVFCTAADDPVHARRQQLIARHVTPDMLRVHAATMVEIWGAAIEHLVSIPAGCHSVEHSNINQDLLFTTQRVAVRCWLGVEPTPAETLDTLQRYFDPGRLLSEVLFDTWYFLHARRRVASLRHSYAPLLARSIDALAMQEGVAPQARFIAASLDEFGWDRARLASDTQYRSRLLADLPFYQHLFTVMLPAMGSTGGTILFLIRQLAADPRLQDALHEELAHTDLVAQPHPPPLTGRAIHECLRRFPQAAGITRLLRTARTYGGYFVPRGAYTFTQLHALHHNPCRHADPDRFDPSRTLSTSDGGWAGFSLGPMACTGRRFAELQIAVALQALLARYRIAGPPPDPDAHNDYQGSVTLQPHPFSITFTAR
ncbi:MAG: cytochrome P450 [Acetobacteraceae bacterium]